MDGNYANQDNLEKRTLVKIAEIEISIALTYNDENIAIVNNRLNSILSEITPYETKSVTNVAYTIELSDGSILAKIKIYAFAVTLVTTISNYGAFRQGAEMLIHDVETVSNKVAEYVKEHIDFRSSAPVIVPNVELVRETERVLSGIDALEKKTGGISHRDVNNRIKKLKRDLAAIHALLSYEEKQTFLNSIPLNIQKLPKPSKARVQELRELYFLKPDTVVVRRF